MRADRLKILPTLYPTDPGWGSWCMCVSSGFGFHPANPGWGVGACVFVCALRLYPAIPSSVVRCGCVCSGSGFGCAPPFLAGVLAPSVTHQPPSVTHQPPSVPHRPPSEGVLDTPSFFSFHYGTPWVGDMDTNPFGHRVPATLFIVRCMGNSMSGDHYEMTSTDTLGVNRMGGGCTGRVGVNIARTPR